MAYLIVRGDTQRQLSMINCFTHSSWPKISITLSHYFFREDDEDQEEPYIPDDDAYDPKKVDDILVHDCGNVRDFQADYAKNDLTNPLWKLVANEREPKRYRKLPKIVKYNHAYGIPVFGVEHFKNESMTRACYLIRL